MNDLCKSHGPRRKKGRRVVQRRSKLTDDQVKLLTSAAARVPMQVTHVVHRLRRLMNRYHIDSMVIDRQSEVVAVSRMVKQEVTI